MIRHSHQSAVADPVDPLIIGKTKWNDDHAIDEVTFSGTIPLTVGVKNFNLWTVTAAPDASSGELRSFYLDAYTRPVANYGSFPTAAFISQTHDSGAFNLTNGLRGIVGQVVQNVGATTVNEARGLQGAYRSLAGTITQGIGLLIARGFAGDGGAVGTGVGIKILAHAAPTPSVADIAIQSLGGHHRFVGGLRIGADSAPDGMLHVDGQTQIVQASNGTDAIIARRFTDSVPTGDLFKALSADGNTVLFRVVASPEATPLYLSINGAAAIQVKIGANGTGPGGVGRAMFVDNG
jgi:hypothetical protein